MALSPPVLAGQVMPHPHHMGAAGPGGSMMPLPMGMPPPPGGMGVGMGPPELQMQVRGSSDVLFLACVHGWERCYGGITVF